MGICCEGGLTGADGTAAEFEVTLHGSCLLPAEDELGFNPKEAPLICSVEGNVEKTGDPF
jgi:hypothetical protein